MTFESDEKSPKPVVIFKIERPPFWTSFLPVTSIKGMSAAMFWRHSAHIHSLGNNSLWRVESKLLGLWLRSSLILLNPCETVRSQRKTMFTRVKVSAEEEINRSVYASVVRSRTEKGNKRKNVYDARRSIEEAVNKISGEYYFCIQQMLIILALGR